MSSIDNHDYSNFTTESAHPHYKNIPLDLTTSPLEIYFRDMYLSSQQEDSNDQELFTDTTTAASSIESLASYGRVEPILIPGVTNPDEARIGRRRKRRERLSRTVPNTMNDYAALLDSNNNNTRQPIFPPERAVSGTQSNNQISERGKSAFTVGSLVDRPPVPWPASFILPHDNSRNRHLRQRKNDRIRDSIANDDNIFQFEDDDGFSDMSFSF